MTRLTAISVRFVSVDRPAFPRHFRLEAIMAYDRYDREMRWREGRRDPSKDRGPRGWDRDNDRNRDFNRSEDDRGFLGRMGDEFRSWFGDEDRERGPDFNRDREQDWEDRQRRSRFDEPSRPPGGSRDEDR